MAINQEPPLILAIDPTPSILGLYGSLLTTAGYRTSTQSFAASDVSAVKALHPDPIILGELWDQNGKGWDLLVGSFSSPATRSIPILLSTFADRQIARRASTLRATEVATLQTVRAIRPAERSRQVDTGQRRGTADHDQNGLWATANACMRSPKPPSFAAGGDQMTSSTSNSESGDEPIAPHRTVDDLRHPVRPQKAAKPPKPRKVEKRRRGRKS
jgi:hypothetical protein